MKENHEYWIELRDQLELQLDLICERVNISGVLIDWSFRDYLTLDIMRFLLNICNADGEITEEELEFIKQVFDYNLSADEWQEYIQREGLCDYNFIKTPPYTLDFVIEAENRENNSKSSLSKIYIELFDELARKSIAADNTHTKGEVRIRDKYITFLCEYANKNLDRKWNNFSLRTRIAEDAEIAKKKHNFKKDKDIANFIQSAKELAESFPIAHPEWNWNNCGESLMSEYKTFLLCLAAANGKIGSAEANFIRVYFGAEIDSFSLQREIDLEKTNFKEFLETIPLTLKRYTIHDIDCDAEGRICRHTGFLYIRGFELLGNSFLLCSGEVSEEGLAVYENYINMLRSSYSKTFPGVCDSKIVISPELRMATLDNRVVDNDNASRAATDKGAQAKSGKQIDKESVTLEDLLNELQSLIGLQSVKDNVTSLIHMQEVQKMRKQRGMKLMPTSNHLVFYGNPGTGKTTVARLIARIYQKMGIIRKGDIVEVDRSGLVGGYVGQTAIKVQEVIKKALGGVLFVDEAYTLTQKAGSNDYGQEAVDTLLKAMEDNREDLIVIVAGYPDLMAAFIASNPGLASRFNKYINFEDYSPEELLEIFKGMCKKNGYVPTEDALRLVSMLLAEKYAKRDQNFANAREVRNIFETIAANQANRLFHISHPSNEELALITADDVASLL